MNEIFKGTLLAALALVALGAPDAAAQQCNVLKTISTPDNTGSVNGQIFYDVEVFKAGGILIDSMDIDCGTQTLPGTPFTMDVYTVPGTYVGNETNQGAWTLVSSGSGVVVGTPIPSPVALSDFTVPTGTWGFALVLNGASHRYTNGTGANQIYQNADLKITTGAALNVPWTGTPFSPRVWNGAIYYDCANVTIFCTAKNGLACGVPAISSSGIPSATSGSFVVSSGPARSCKNGILLYNTAQITPGLGFQGGTLCVDPMGLRRAGPTDSMGTPGGASCDGKFAIDMNSFTTGAWIVPDCAGAPSGLPPNNPAAFLATPGTDIYTTFWGRDSVATGSFVSNGLRYTQGP